LNMEVNLTPWFQKINSWEDLLKNKITQKF
jgi:hypothetical protein